MTWKTKMIMLENFRNLDWNIILNFISVFQWRLNYLQLFLNDLKSLGFKVTAVISKSVSCSKNKTLKDKVSTVKHCYVWSWHFIKSENTSLCCQFLVVSKCLQISTVYQNVPLVFKDALVSPCIWHLFGVVNKKR